MKASRFTAEQIVGILHEAAVGGVVRELWRRHGITETTFYRWRRQPEGWRLPPLSAEAGYRMEGPPYR